MVCMWNMDIKAASGSLSLSNVSGTVGSIVTVTGKINATEAISAATIIFQYKPSELQYIESNGISGGAGSVKYFVDVIGQGKKTISFNLKFKILKEGSFKLQSTNVDVITDGDTLEKIAINNASSTITGKVATVNNNTNNNNNNSTINQDNKDSNNKLSSLQIYPGTLSPAFDAATTSYAVTVPSDTTEVTITATAQSSKATVNVSGGKDLKLGANEAKVVVVAENGASAAYTITIMCGEAEKIQVGGAEHTINESFTDEQIPTGFSRTKVTYNEREYEALENANASLHLLYLQSGENSYFYIYNQEAQEFYNFVQVQIAEGKYIILLPLDNSVKEFAEHEIVPIKVQDKNFDSWKLNDEFSVVHAINQDGQEVFYRYDSVDGVFQRYVQETITVSDDEKILFPSEYYMYAIVGLGTLSIILLIAMIYFIASRKARHEGRKRKVMKKLEKKRVKEEKKLAKENKKNREE